MSSKPKSQLVLSILLVAIGAIAGGATIAIALMSEKTSVAMVAFAAGAVGALIVASVLAVLNRHFIAMERLRGAVVAAMAPEAVTLPEGIWREDPETADIHDAVNALIVRRREMRIQIEERLAAVLASVAEAVLVVSEDGMVTLVNGEALNLLGADRVATGTSVFAALHRHPVERALERVKTDGRGVDVTLETVDGRSLQARVSELEHHGGIVISFSVQSLEREARFQHDLTLHDALPDIKEINEATPLADTPFLVLDTETTGLDVKKDTILSIGAVRMHGQRIYRDIVIDWLVDPGQPIPAASTRVHGITDSMVAHARSFNDVWPDLAARLDGVVLVGHNIAFDVAHLRHAAARAGVDWRPGYVLDTLLLMTAIDPRLDGLELDALAAHFGVIIRGRHTALGDCLVTAEIFARLQARLEHDGSGTLGDAIAYQSRAGKILAQQRSSGWFDDPVVSG